jgi:hypothetical protein
MDRNSVAFVFLLFHSLFCKHNSIMAFPKNAAFGRNNVQKVEDRNDIFFVDFQLLHYLDKQLIYKEFCMTNASHTVFRKCMYDPPAYCSAPPKNTSEYVSNEWVRNNHHQLTWNQGISPYHKIVDDVRNILIFKPRVIFVKGTEKIRFLQNLLLNSLETRKDMSNQYNQIFNIPIYDLGGSFMFASLKRLRQDTPLHIVSNFKRMCPLHNNTHCAVFNVCLLRYHYLQDLEKLRSENPTQPFHSNQIYTVGPPPSP